MKKTELEALKEKLFYKKENVFDTRTKKDEKKISDYAKGYMSFLDNAKTEREAVVEGIKMLEKAGFVEYTLGGEIKAGGKYYLNNRGKSLFAFVAGTDNIENGIRICAAHVDSPRLDLKQHPMFENEGFAYLKTHYYGGIRKYQWVTIPLALHGVVTTADGSSVEVVIGEDDKDPVFCITDLLPHLAREQSQKLLGTAHAGESLNLLIGSQPLDGATEDKVKFNMLKILNDKYGICESDFVSAELTAVPAGKARDLGLDRSMIAAYGHDDRVCAYPSLTAIIENKDSKNTIMCILADKEEIGSEGVSGMKCRLIVDLIEEIAKNLGGNPNVVRANSMCLSADVSAGYDPMYPEVFEKRNSAIINCGVVMNKYTGGGGKSSTNDASAEYVGHIRRVFKEAGVVWQTAELGKIDVGGGGTVAMYIANQNINTVDLGVAVLSMHAPMEVISKNDLYEAHKALSAFCK